MNSFITVIFLVFIGHAFCDEVPGKDKYKWPTIGISVLVRNQGHTLPYFFSSLHKLDYPKDRLYIWIYTDFNKDNSMDVITKWAEIYAKQYRDVYIHNDRSTGPRFGDEHWQTNWTSLHYTHMIKLREQALVFARKQWAEYLFMVDADVYLTNPEALKILVKKELSVVAPMLVSNGYYSNFWCGMTTDYYYLKTDECTKIVNGENTGCFEVVMVHTAVLISLREQASDELTYDPQVAQNYRGPEDDILVFALNARNRGIKLNICNDHFYGYGQVPVPDITNLYRDNLQLMNTKVIALSTGSPLPLEQPLAEFVIYPKPTTLGCDMIFMINLERRPERRAHMELNFKELGMKVQTLAAVDGRNLDLNNLKEYAITLMPKYEDPYHKRPMKAGEVGCFLSHYFIWKKIIEEKYEITLILEDDIHFTPDFHRHYKNTKTDLENLDWDLTYIGRKPLFEEDEIFTTDYTSKPLYSYWTLGYLITLRGARKLVDANPLRKMIPVDEFLPIMYNQHPNETWKSYFPKRDLIAYSSYPLLVQPTHYTGQEGYISDTEDSPIIPVKLPAFERIDL